MQFRSSDLLVVKRSVAVGAVHSSALLCFPQRILLLLYTESELIIFYSRYYTDSAEVRHTTPHQKSQTILLSHFFHPYPNF